MAQVPVLLIGWFGAAALTWAQDPFQVAGDHYRQIFDNAWAQGVHVGYPAHGKSPVHDHPSTPTIVFVYVTDGGPLRFYHKTGPENVMGLDFERPAVKAGAIRFAAGIAETHAVEYMGDTPMEYVRIELKTEPLDLPAKDVRLPPVVLDATKAALHSQFENGQLRILRVMCPAGQDCPASEHPGDPAVVVTMSGAKRGQLEWSPVGVEHGPLEQVRVELKTKPVSGVN
jgi:hypothetical protein